MIKQTNERITITLSKSQVNWLKTLAKQKQITVSTLVSYMLMSDIEKLCTILERNNHNLQETIRIAKTKWLDVDFNIR